MGLLGKFFNLFTNSKPKIGDVIVCLDDRNWNTFQTDIKLVYDKKYKIQNIIEECHFYGYDIGARLTPNTLFTICSCNKEIKGMGIHWVLARRFRKATRSEYLEFHLDELKMELENSIENEDYNRASEIKKELEKSINLNKKK